MRAFANAIGLKEALRRRGTACDIVQQRAFASGFNLHLLEESKVLILNGYVLNIYDDVLTVAIQGS